MNREPYDPWNPTLPPWIFIAIWAVVLATVFSIAAEKIGQRRPAHTLIRPSNVAEAMKTP